jgi:hypothetical protein
VTSVPLGSKLRISPPTVMLPPDVSVSPAITTPVTGGCGGRTPVAKVVGSGVGEGNVMISPPIVIALPGNNVWELMTNPPPVPAVSVEPSMTTIAGGVVVGPGMYPLTITAPPELTETRCPSLRVTAEPGVTVCEPITMAESEFIEMVWDPSKIGEAGPAVVGAAFEGEFEGSVAEEALPGCPVPVTLWLAVTPPWPPPGDVAEGDDWLGCWDGVGIELDSWVGGPMPIMLNDGVGVGVGGSKIDSDDWIVRKVLVEVVGPGPGSPVWVGQKGGQEIDESPWPGGLGPLDGPLGPLIEVGRGGLLNEIFIWVGQACWEVEESPLPGGLGPFGGPLGLLIEVDGAGSLREGNAWVGPTGGEEVVESPWTGGLGPLGPLGGLIETEADAVPDEGVGLVAVSVLTGGDDPVKDTSWGPPGPLFPPAAAIVAITVTVCKHEPEVDTKCWPWVEVTVVVHGAIAIAIEEVEGVLVEVVASDLVLPFCDEIGATGEFGLVEWASGLEDVDLVWLEGGEGLELVVVGWTVTTVCSDTEEDVSTGGTEDEVVGWGVDTEWEVVATGTGAEELLSGVISVAFSFLWTSIIASQNGKHLSIKPQIADH